MADTLTMQCVFVCMLAQLVAVAFLPIAVIALADAISDIQMITVRRSIRETDFGKTCDECLLRDSVSNIISRDVCAACQMLATCLACFAGARGRAT